MQRIPNPAQGSHWSTCISILEQFISGHYLIIKSEVDVRQLQQQVANNSAAFYQWNSILVNTVVWFYLLTNDGFPHNTMHVGVTNTTLFLYTFWVNCFSNALALAFRADNTSLVRVEIALEFSFGQSMSVHEN